MEHVATIFAREGSNAWFARPAGELLPRRRRSAPCGQARELEKQHDIVDVWFESGVSWAAVADGKLVAQGREGRSLPRRAPTSTAAGSTRRCWPRSPRADRAPYKAVLTHGWVLDERGKVYSKSEIEKARAAGVKIDYVEPGVWMEKNGAELLRLWTAAADYQ